MGRVAVLAGVVIGLLAGAFGIGYVVGSHAHDTRVPDLLGMGTDRGGQGEARTALNQVGLRVGKVSWRICTADEFGLVVHHDPPGGAVTPQGSTVNISIGTDERTIFGTPDPCLPGQQVPANHPGN